jgi:hypothetical protein
MARETSARIRPLAAGAVLLFFSCVVQIWIISSGTWIHWNHTTHAYAQMAERFLQGHLSLGDESGPDAFKPDPQWPVNLLDASPYHGYFYYYWGPVPAALLAGTCRVMGISHPRLGDPYLAFVFALGAQTCAMLLIFQIIARFFPAQPTSGAGVATLSFALGMPILFCLSQPAIYETAVLAGQCFLLAGLLAAWLGLKNEQLRPAPLAAAGLCWAMAAGSRISLPPAAVALAAITLWYVRRGAECRARKWNAAFALMLPMAAGLAILAWYNFARFGSILESGESYQVNRISEPGMWASGFISPANVIPNLMVYLFMPPYHTHGFPYLLAVSRQLWLGGVFAIRQRLVTDPIVGLAWTQPFLILGFLAIPWRRSQNPGVPDERPLKWLRAALLAGAALGFAPPLSMNFTSTRYLLDGLPCLSILAAIGFISLLRRFDHRPRLVAEIRAVVRTMVVLQCIVGVLLAIARNPPLARSLLVHWPVL